MFTVEEMRDRVEQFERVAQNIIDHLVKMSVLKLLKPSLHDANLDSIKGHILAILTSNGPALAEVPASRSWDSKTIRRQMATGGYVLLLNREEAKLYRTNGAVGLSPLELPVSLAEAEKLVRGDCGSYYVGALTQFRNRNRLGWREVVGDLGEKYDVYTLVQ